MAKFEVPKPKEPRPKVQGTKGTPPIAPSNTLQTPTSPIMRELVAMNFKVEPEFRREFKLYCLEQDKSMVEVLKEAIALHRQQQG